MKTNHISLASVSWIDEKTIPKVGFWFVAGALVSWPKRVIMGLAGTSNPEPPLKLTSMNGFVSKKQYRALISCSVDINPIAVARNIVVDAGYTPPFDKNKLDTRLRNFVPGPDDPKFYPGESSPLSGVSVGKAHSSSTVRVPRDSKVIVNALIKFRAGEHTDKIGIDKANSPVHIPWVWCEYMLTSSPSGIRLLCNGSIFPSHAWYVNGEQVAKRLQMPISVSENDPVLSTGQPAKHLLLKAQSDRSDGTIVGHQHTVQGGELIDVKVTLPMK